MRRYSLTQSADGAAGVVTAETAPVHGMELCFAGPGSRMGSSCGMLELRD